MTKGQRVRLRNLEGTQFTFEDFDSFHVIKTAGSTVKRIHGRIMKKYFGLNQDNSLIEGTILDVKILENAGIKYSRDGSKSPKAKKQVRVEWDNGHFNTFWSGNLEVI